MKLTEKEARIAARGLLDRKQAHTAEYGHRGTCFYALDKVAPFAGIGYEFNWNCRGHFFVSVPIDVGEGITVTNCHFAINRPIARKNANYACAAIVLAMDQVGWIED